MMKSLDADYFARLLNLKSCCKSQANATRGLVRGIFKLTGSEVRSSLHMGSIPDDSHGSVGMIIPTMGIIR